jgi:GT2 family glycosyltransferase
MNPVLMLTHNCLELTKRCVASLDQQDMPNQIYMFDNGSTDGTREWMADTFGYGGTWTALNRGVSYPWNFGIRTFFETKSKYRSDHILVVNNDTILPPWFYRELLSYDVPFVTGISVDNMDQIKEPAPRVELVGHPDFSAFLIRRDAWDKIGPFDERMKFYAQDCDYHVRAHRLGIPLWCANVPFYHARSSTLQLAPEKERLEIGEQANRDRQVFREKYGCIPGEPAYEELFQ